MFDYRWRSLHLYPLLQAIACKEKPKSYLGIGVWKGDCIGNLISAYKGLDEVIICDPLIGHCGGPTDPAFLLPKLRAKGFTGELNFLHGPSDPTLTHWWTPGRTIDMALIDGDHNYGPAWYDLCITVPHTRITLVHDLDHSSVWDAFRKYIQQHPHPFWVTAEQQGTGIILNERPR